MVVYLELLTLFYLFWSKADVSMASPDPVVLPSPESVRTNMCV